MIMIRNRLSEKPAAFGSSRWLWGWFAFIYRPVRIIAIAKASDTKRNTCVLLVLFVMVQFAIGGAIETLAAALCATGGYNALALENLTQRKRCSIFNRYLSQKTSCVCLQACFLQL